MTVAGASQYLNAARLANAKGTSPSTPSLLNTGASTASLLQAGRNALSVSGIGLSSSARALTEQFLSRTDDINSLFSLGAGSDSTVEGAKQQILALRAKLSERQVAPGLLDESAGEEDSADTVAADTTKGTTVDTTA